MTLHIVRLGSPRLRGEGVRIGAVRRPPRGIRRDRYAADNWFDVWFPNLAPSAALMKRGKAVANDSDWAAFARAFKTELDGAPTQRTLDLLAALSRTCSFSIGCYCEDEARCHRSVLRRLLLERGAELGR